MLPCFYDWRFRKSRLHVLPDSVHKYLSIARPLICYLISFAFTVELWSFVGSAAESWLCAQLNDTLLPGPTCGSDMPHNSPINIIHSSDTLPIILDCNCNSVPCHLPSIIISNLTSYFIANQQSKDHTKPVDKLNRHLNVVVEISEAKLNLNLNYFRLNREALSERERQQFSELSWQWK